MTDSDDDFVEVSGYKSGSDSEWEKIEEGEGNISFSEGEEEREELVPVTNMKINAYPEELVSSYYQPHWHVEPEATVPTARDNEKSKSKANNNKPECKERKEKGEKVKKKKHFWDKVTLKRGHGAPYDPVEFLGITGGEKALLSHFSITTIGQLANFNAMDFASNTQSEKFAVILDLQERAYEAVTEYVTKVSTQPETVWGYLYLDDKSLKQVLHKGYLDSDSLFFLWSPMPTTKYRDQLAIDRLVGMETNNQEVRTRYSRFVKINLTKLCNKYFGRLYQRDPFDQVAAGKWISVSLLEGAELAQKEEVWLAFEPGNDIFSCVTHGSIVIPTGRIPQDCMELDKETCAFLNHTLDESSSDEVEEPNPIIAAQLEFY